METAETAGRGDTMDNRTGLLFPLMLIAAVAVIAFSAIGIATMLGWTDALASTGSVTRTAAADAAPVARCAECGRILSVLPDGVRVRMDDGSIRAFSARAQSPFSVGQKVRVTDQGVAAAG